MGAMETELITLIIERLIQALWTNEDGEALWTDEDGNPLWTEGE